MKNWLLWSTLALAGHAAASCVESGQVVDTVTGVVTVVCRAPETPKAGIFDSAAPSQEMQSNPTLGMPAKVTTFDLEEIVTPTSFKGIYGMTSGRVELEGIQMIPGQEDAGLEFLQTILPAQIVLYAEPTGEYRNNHPAAYVWLGRSLLNVMLVEQGFAQADGTKSRYAGAFAKAQNFAKEHHLGAYAEKK